MASNDELESIIVSNPHVRGVIEANKHFAKLERMTESEQLSYLKRVREERYGTTANKEKPQLKFLSPFG